MAVLHQLRTFVAALTKCNSDLRLGHGDSNWGFIVEIWRIKIVLRKSEGDQVGIPDNVRVGNNNGVWFPGRWTLQRADSVHY